MSETLEKKSTPKTPWVMDMLSRIIGLSALDGRNPLTENQYQKIYNDKPSFSQYLNFKEYNKDSEVFYLDDDVSVGAVFEVTPVDVEGRPMDILKKIESSIQKSLHGIPGYHDSPWIIQSFLQDDPISYELIDSIKNYATPEAKKTQHFKNWIAELEEHVVHLSKPGGLFYDSASQFNWNGHNRHIRIVVYRNSKKSEWLTKTGKPIPGRGTPSDELNEVLSGFIGQLNQMGMATKRYSGQDLFNWLLPWFSPKPDGFKDVWEYLKKRNFTNSDEEIGYGADLSEMMTIGYPESNEDGIWRFNGMPHRIIPLQAIDTPPITGVLTAEQEMGTSGKTASMWDKLPKGSIFATTIVIEPQSKMKAHCEDIIKAAGQGSSEASAASLQANAAKDNIAAGKYLYPSFSCVYVRGKDDEELHKNLQRATQVLIGFQFNPILPRYDPTSCDNYLRFLPMSYSYERDKKTTRLTRLTYSHHLARILPLYGRAIGTGNPGKLFYDRVGGAFLFDPVKDRSRVAHSLIFGPTGSGKSATINYMVMHDMAMCKPRTFIIEKGDSFSLLGQYFKSTGLTVNRVKFTTSTNISLPPYTKAFEALEKAEEDEQSMEKALLQSVDSSFDQEGDLINNEDDEMRDYLGEMELITRMMITGANIDLENKFELPDKLIVRKAILEATRIQRDAQINYVIPSNIVAVIRSYATDDNISDTRKERIISMADSLDYWTNGLHGKFFNRPGEAWPEVDVTILDMGILTDDQYKDMLAVTMVSLINTITGIGEKYQYEGRQTQVWTDEGHVLTGNPIIVKPLIFGAKTWRKLNIWLNQATQSISDYPKEAEKMLSLAEWWYCLCMDESDVEELNKFKKLTNEERELVKSARKEKGKYTEGVVLSDNIKSLFRIVMPALPLALAGTDDDEKAARRKLMKEHNCSEIEAIYYVVDRIKSARNEGC